MTTLFAWLGNADLECSLGKGELGPIAGAIHDRKPSRVVVVSAQEPQAARQYELWLDQLANETEVCLRQTTISDPWDFARIYHESTAAVEEEVSQRGRTIKLVFHLSPGTGAMSAAWIILSKTRFPAELIESSQRDVLGRYPVRTVNLPFDLSVELVGDLLRKPGEEFVRLSQALPPAHSEFSTIIRKSRVMEDVVRQAAQWAPVDTVPVLILGESGTGKELLARAIHAASPRASKPFRAINCGAIPQTLIESELFGYVKGAFSGATRDHTGMFESADGGTVFLDEIGELPKDAQVKLLRVLQEGAVTRVGDTEEIKLNLRPIAATNRDLFNDVVENRFREDLFYRLAIAIIKIPPLRERLEDIDALIEYFRLPQSSNPIRAKLTPSAKRRLREHDWPGNVRELESTLRRAAPPWIAETQMTEQAIEEAILKFPKSERGPLDRPLGGGFSLPELLEEVRNSYMERALQTANGNQTKAAELLGLTRQTLANWSREVRKAN